VDVRITTFIDGSLHRPLVELAAAERRSVREQAGLLLERKILEEHARLQQDPEALMRLAPAEDAPPCAEAVGS
jgi:hypothetical protein